MKYCAYGSNCNLEQMYMRCPNDTVKIGIGFLNNKALRFKGIATISYKKGSRVPVVLFDIKSELDWNNLDAYEGLKNKLYIKKTVMVHMPDGTVVSAITYVLKRKLDYLSPSSSYLETIKIGYIENNLDIDVLLASVKHSIESMRSKFVIRREEMRKRVARSWGDDNE